MSGASPVETQPSTARICLTSVVDSLATTGLFFAPFRSLSNFFAFFSCTLKGAKSRWLSIYKDPSAPRTNVFLPPPPLLLFFLARAIGYFPFWLYHQNRAFITCMSNVHSINPENAGAV